MYGPIADMLQVDNSHSEKRSNLQHFQGSIQPFHDTTV